MPASKIFNFGFRLMKKKTPKGGKIYKKGTLEVSETTARRMASGGGKSKAKKDVFRTYKGKDGKTRTVRVQTSKKTQKQLDGNRDAAIERVTAKAKKAKVVQAVKSRAAGEARARGSLSRTQRTKLKRLKKKRDSAKTAQKRAEVQEQIDALVKQGNANISRKRRLQAVAGQR